MRERNVYSGIVAAVIGLSLLIAGCGKRQEPQGQATGPAGPERPRATQQSPVAGAPVRVGAILGRTGDYASYGIKMQRGYEVAAEEINATGGIRGANVGLVIEDSDFDPNKAVTAYRRLRDVHRVGIIVGITGSSCAIPVCQNSTEDNIIIVDPLGSAPMLTTVGGPNYFRIMASDALAGTYNVGWARERGMRRPAVVYVEDQWGNSYKDSVLACLESNGFAAAPAFGITKGSREFRNQIQRIKEYGPDALFLLIYAKDGAYLMQQLRQAGIQAIAYGSDNISSPEFAAAGAEVVEGTLVAMPATVEGTAFEAFASRFERKFGERPDANVIKSYDALMLVSEAMRSVGTDPAVLRRHLRSPDFSYSGISGTIRFDQNGDLVSQEYSRMIYRNGQLVPLTAPEHE